MTVGSLASAIQQHLDLQRESRLPLYAQVRDALRDWLLAQPDGTRVPSERALTDITGVNRRTLRKAIEELIAAGLLARRGRRLFVHLPADPAPMAPHSFMSQVASPVVALRTLRFSVYEWLPWQREAWSAIAERFQALNPDIQIELDWLPGDVDTTDRYETYIRERHIDLALYWKGTLRLLGNRGRILPLSDAVLERLRGPDFATPCFQSDASLAAGTFGAPVHLNLWLCLWNEELVARTGVSRPAVLTMDSLIDWIVQVGQRLPPGVAALADPLEFSILMGQPPTPMSHADAVALAATYIDLARRLEPIRDRLVWPAGGDTKPAECYAFAEGRCAFYFGPSYFVMGYLRDATFPWRMCSPELPAGHRLTASLTEIGISSDCHDPLAANEFVQFLLSRDAQRIVAESRVNGPIRHDVAPLLNLYLRPDPPDSLQRMMRDMVAYDATGESWMQFHCRTLRHQLQLCLTGKSSFSNLDPAALVEEVARQHPSPVRSTV